MTDLDAALREQLLNISVAERKAVVQPDGVLDDGHWESVAIRFQLGHGGSAYPRPIKATQPERCTDVRTQSAMLYWAPPRHATNRPSLSR